jgi:hypothetical protein
MAATRPPPCERSPTRRAPGAHPTRTALDGRLKYRPRPLGDYPAHMVQISSRPATPEIRSLFDPGTSASLRCFAVLDGSAAGQVWADNASDPTWAVAQEAGFGSIYLGGSLDAQTLSQIVAELRKDGDVLIGLSYEDERFELLPPNPDYVGATLEFTNRSIGEGLAIFSARVPAGCELRRIDHAIFERCLERDLLAGIFGSAEKALDNGFGHCLMKGSQILTAPSTISLPPRLRASWATASRESTSWSHGSSEIDT